MNHFADAAARLRWPSLIGAAVLVILTTVSCIDNPEEALLDGMSDEVLDCLIAADASPDEPAYATITCSTSPIPDYYSWSGEGDYAVFRTGGTDEAGFCSGEPLPPGPPFPIEISGPTGPGVDYVDGAIYYEVNPGCLGPGSDGRINQHFGDLVVAIYPNTDDNGDPTLDFYCVGPDGGSYAFTIDQSVFDKAPAKPDQDTLVYTSEACSKPIRIYVLTTGEYQINIGADGDKIDVIIFTGLPPANIYYKHLDPLAAP
jgi:hypothetical protein